MFALQLFAYRMLFCNSGLSFLSLCKDGTLTFSPCTSEQRGEGRTSENTRNRKKKVILLIYWQSAQSRASERKSVCMSVYVYMCVCVCVCVCVRALSRFTGSWRRSHLQISALAGQLGQYFHYLLPKRGVFLLT